MNGFLNSLKNADLLSQSKSSLKWHLFVRNEIDINCIDLKAKKYELNKGDCLSILAMNHESKFSFPFIKSIKPNCKFVNSTNLLRKVW